MAEADQTISLADLPKWKDELLAFVQETQWDPDKWTAQTRWLHRKICAAEFLLHALSKEP